VFRHRLALALHKTVGEIEATMTVRELNDWRRFEGLNRRPLPDQLSDIHFAMVLSTMVNLMRTSEAPAMSAADFFVLRERAESEVSEIDRLRAQWRGD
jgi:hypothetical protein